MRFFHNLLMLPIMLNAALALGQGKVTGIVGEDETTPALFATVALLTPGDSALVKGTVTDESGKFTIEGVPYGAYVVAVTYIGFEKSVSGPLEISAAAPLADLGRITLRKTAYALEEVVVEGRKNVIERTFDRYVMNVSTGTFAAANLLDIFRAVPFMAVQGKAVYFQGRSNLLVLVDDRPIAKETVGNLLQSLSGSEIEKIEFITNPSAQYDASVDGVIRITTKKGAGLGVTGTARGSVSKGVYAYGSAGVNVIYKKEKMTVSGRYGFNGGQYWTDRQGYRSFDFGSLSRVYNTSDNQVYDDRIHVAQLGADFRLHRNHTLGVILEANLNDTPGSRWDSYTAFSNAVGGPADSTLYSPKRIDYRSVTGNISLNYRGVLDTMGKQINVIVTNTPMDGSLTNTLPQQLVAGPDGRPFRSIEAIRNNNPYAFNIWIGQLDLALPFRNNWKVEGGLKATYSGNDSRTFQEQNTDGVWQEIPAFSFTNSFRERIAAGYLSVSKQVSNTYLQAGLRLENTSATARNVFSRNYTNLFPTLVLQQKVSDNYQVTLNYRKKIVRPAFGYLIPYVFYMDEYTIGEGNAALRPQLSDVFSLTQNIRKNLTASLEYTIDRDWFTELPRQEGQRIIFTPTNVDALRTLALNVNLASQISSWWQTNNYASASHYSVAGNTNNADVAINRVGWTLGTSHTFSLPGDWQVEAAFNYYSPAVFGLYYSDAYHYSRLAVKRSFLDRKLHANLALEDIFRGSVYGYRLRAGSLENQFFSYSDTRRIAAGLVYQFGKQTVKGPGRKSLGNEDVLQRTRRN